MEREKMQQRKVLDWEKPITIAWPETNFLLSILKNVKNGWDWILNSHIQLRASRYENFEWNIKDSRITFYPYGMHDLSPNIYDQCPFIDKYILPRKYINDMFSEFTDFIEYAILQDFYVCTYVDQYFRKDINYFGFEHPIYIYGFDREEKMVYAADNFENGKYGSKKLSYDMIDSAYAFVSKEKWEESVFLYHLKEHEYTFSSKFVLEQIEDYLSPDKSLCYLNRMMCPEPDYVCEVYTNHIYFGIECYFFLEQNIKALIEDSTDYLTEDIRSFCLLEDHKLLMLMRCDYMMEHGYMEQDEELKDSLQKQLDESRIMSNLFLKYTIKSDVKILYQINDILNNFVEQEKNLMRKIADHIIVH